QIVAVLPCGKCLCVVSHSSCSQSLAPLAQYLWLLIKHTIKIENQSDHSELFRERTDLTENS
ncbi:MAG: hypothetical protein J0H24_05425, partial [Delftia acidovorans]|nr:hypothetical protein [Delftia acidovorans]